MIVAAFTDKGGREINEDRLCALYDEDKGFFAVCDGLGGHDLGEVAAQLAVDTFEEIYKSHPQMSGEDLLSDMFEQAQAAILEKQKVNHTPHKMKTTAVSLLIDKNRAVFAHIGDSRLYEVKDGHVKRLTVDHSVVQMLVFAGDISESEIRNHPDRNRLLRVMGTEWDQNRRLYDIGDEKSADAYLLCSDGFWELIEEKDMEKAYSQAKSPREWIDCMLEVVNSAGADKNMDNYTAIAVFCNKKKKLFGLF